MICHNNLYNDYCGISYIKIIIGDKNFTYLEKDFDNHFLNLITFRENRLKYIIYVY